MANQKKPATNKMTPCLSPSAEADLLAQAVASGNAHVLAHALCTLARAQGITGIAQQIGFNRGQMYRTLGKKGNPMLSTLLKVLDALGLEMHIQRRDDGTMKAKASRTT